MAGSAADAIGQAVERTKQLLLQPLKPEKWFTLGLTVFLAQCGEGNFNSFQAPNIPFGGGSFSKPSGSPLTDFQKLIDEGVRAFYDDLALYVTLASVGLLLTIGLGLLVIWFSSRAKLMLVESVIHDRVNVSQQWARAAELGMSVFKFRLLIQLGGGFLGLGTIILGAALAFSDLQAGHFSGPHALMGYALLGFATLLLGLPIALTMLLFDDFVLPLMVVRNVRVGEAWGICRREVLAGNWGNLVLFYVLRVLLGFGIVIAVWILNCVTCCLISLPYLGTVLLLPVFVFWRAFSLYFMEQLGLRIFPTPDPSWQAYDQWRFPR